MNEYNYKFSIHNPDFSTLGYVSLVANLQDKHDRSAPSDYHWKILKCRMLIFSLRGVLACPAVGDARRVLVVFAMRGGHYDTLVSLCNKYSLQQCEGIEKVTPEIFTQCLQYTMTAWLAPAWCLIGGCYLVAGRDFLTQRQPQPGVKFRITGDENENLLELRAIRINLMRAKLDEGDAARVLPSLNQAAVEESFQTLSDCGRFRCYNDLRRHWKNIHGYRLPEVESECGGYYSVRFWRGEPLTYPALCTLPRHPVISPLPPQQEKAVISSFMSSLKTKMSSIAGAPLSIKVHQEHRDIMQNTMASAALTQSQAVSLCTPTQLSKR